MILIILLFLVCSAWSVMSMCSIDQDVKCNFRGDCVFDVVEMANYCDCYFDEYWGFQHCYDENLCKCNIHLCNYIPYFEDDVCNGNGLCRLKPGNTTTYCDCDFGYTSSFCEDWWCDGIINTNLTHSCNGKGVCSGPNNCTCNENWIGLYCDTPICEPDCLNSGDCVDPDNEDQPCDCEGTGFSGPICETPICTTPCENGVCSSPDFCDCTDSGYKGDYCEFPICSVCTHGDCILPENCSCHDYWDGPTCQTPICDPECKNGTCVSALLCHCFPGYEGVICDQISNCTPPCMFGECNPESNNCSCLYNYTGDQCEVPTCDPPCINGNCTLPNYCNCSDEYEGLLCEIPICEPECYTGDCTSPNNCSCDETRWTGDLCNEPVCDPKCTNGGNCYLPGLCNCNTSISGWDGDYCEIPVCYQIQADQDSVCSGHGNCSLPGQCDCFDNSEYWDGPECGKPKCYGLLNSENGCGYSYGRGMCKDPDICECNGHYALPNCSGCLDHWNGEDCEIPMCDGEYGYEACNGGWGNCTFDIYDDSFECVCAKDVYGETCLEKVGPMHYNTVLSESQEEIEIIVTCDYVIDQSYLSSNMKNEHLFFCNTIISNYEDFGNPIPLCQFVMGGDEYTQYLTFKVTDGESRYFNSFDDLKEVFIVSLITPDLIIHVQGPREGDVPDPIIDDGDDEDNNDDDDNDDDDNSGIGNGSTSTMGTGEVLALVFSLVGFSLCCVCMIFCWLLMTVVFVCLFVGVVAFFGGGGGSVFMAVFRKKRNDYKSKELEERLRNSDDDPFKGFAGTSSSEDDETDSDGGFVKKEEEEEEDPFKGFSGTEEEESEEEEEEEESDDPFKGFSGTEESEEDKKLEKVKKTVLFEKKKKKKKKKEEEDPFKGFEGTESSSSSGNSSSEESETDDDDSDD